MGLSDDQKALLRLLAGREEGYEDIAALKGKSVDEVRAEVKEALAQMQAEEERESRAAAPSPAEEPPAPPDPAASPDPPPAPTPPEPQVPPAAATAKPARSPRAPRPQIPAERRRLVLFAFGALAIVAVVLGAIAILGGDSNSGSSSAETNGSGTELTAAESEKVTQAVLTSADGSDASGQAVFGRVGKEEIVLQVTAENLEPTASGQSYTVWLYRNPKLSLRVGSVPVGAEGRLGARFAIPAELLAYVASGAFDQIHVSRTEDAAYRREVARAKRNKSLPRYIGETILTGEITGPIAKGGGEGG